MKYVVVGMALALMIMMAPAMAADFSVQDDEFAKALLNNTIANLNIGLKFMEILNSANSSGVLKFQNLWGIAYGGIVLAGINNEVTYLVLDNISASPTKVGTIGTAFDDLGSNASTVFGDAAGSKGLAKLLKAQVDVLNGNANILDNYATALANTIYADVEFFIKLANAIPDAFT